MKKSEDFVCYTGVRQGECLSPFLFSMFVNDLEEELISKNFEGLDLDNLRLFLLMYADDIVFLSETAEGLQNGLNCMFQYCQKWELSANTQKTKVIIFRKGGILRQTLHFNYGDHELDIVSRFTYLGIVFTEAQQALSGQAHKANFTLNKYVLKFVNLKPKHILHLFDKLIRPILNYSCEVL